MTRYCENGQRTDVDASDYREGGVVAIDKVARDLAILSSNDQRFLVRSELGYVACVNALCCVIREKTMAAVVSVTSMFAEITGDGDAMDSPDCGRQKTLDSGGSHGFQKHLEIASYAMYQRRQ